METVWTLVIFALLLFTQYTIAEKSWKAALVLPLAVLAAKLMQARFFPGAGWMFVSTGYYATFFIGAGLAAAVLAYRKKTGKARAESGTPLTGRIACGIIRA